MTVTVDNSRGKKIAKLSALGYICICSLFLFALKCEQKEEMSNMGVMVNLGTSETGMVEDNTPTAENTEEVQETQSETQVEESSQNDVIESVTQDVEAAPVTASNQVSTTPSTNTNPTPTAEPVVQEDPKPVVNENALFSGNNNANQGTGNTAGDQGDRDGNLESNIYGDIAGSGFGGAGDGASLNGRGLVSKPNFDNPTNEFGKVVIKITVNKSGKVIKAELVSLYSTNTNQALVNYAIQEAYKFKFNNVASESGARDNQVGKISYNFTAN